MELENITDDINSPKCLKVENKKFITYLTKSILYLYNVKSSNDNILPAPQPVSIEKKDFEKLNKYKYNVSLKLDGVRFLMYFIRDINNTNQCIILNRAFNFYTININVDNTLYNGTLLDGEILFNKETNKWEFLIHDSLMVCGNKINKLNHSERLNDTKLCISSLYKDDQLNTLNISVKKFYEFNDIKYFIDEVYNKSNNNDGIIFMPEKLPVISGTQFSMLKWKPQNKHTFDFLFKRSNIGLEAYVFYMGNLKLFANIYKNTKEGLEFINEINKLNNYSEESIVECSFNKKTNNFTPLLVRNDKTHPNSLRTVERTLFNINENITLDDFLNIKI